MHFNFKTHFQIKIHNWEQNCVFCFPSLFIYLKWVVILEFKIINCTKLRDTFCPNRLKKILHPKLERRYPEIVTADSGRWAAHCTPRCLNLLTPCHRNLRNNHFKDAAISQAVKATKALTQRQHCR